MAGLQTELTSLTLQVALLSAKQSVQDARIIELEANIGILSEQIGFNANLLEQLEAKVLAFSTAGQYSSVNTPLSIWCPFYPSTIEGDLKIYKSVYIDGGVYVRDLLSPSGYKRLDTNLNNLI